MKNSEKIDFVITWVDNNDMGWQREKNKYAPTVNSDDRIERFRDWENLQFFFRGVEKFAPWVNKIFLVTWGHVPKWLVNTHRKLVVVKHEDFMPADALPVFNGCSLEMNLHRIPGLSEKFVYFNDDMFLLKKVKEKDFFYKGLPCDSAVLSVHCYSEVTWFHFAAFRHVGVMNKYFDMKQVIKNNWWKWFNLKYGTKMLQTIILLNCPRFPGFWPNHLPQSFLKSTFEEVWGLEKERLLEVTYHKFRDVLDMSQWLFKNWQICKGTFYPRNIKRSGKAFELRDGINPSIDAARYIRKQKGKMVCINDGRLTEAEYEISKNNIIQAFESILPEKSSFEK